MDEIARASDAGRGSPPTVRPNEGHVHVLAQARPSTGLESPTAPLLPRALVEAAQSGERSAFETIVERTLDRAYRTARAILGSDADACDATQEAFVHAWRQLPALRDAALFDAWFKSILVNSCRKTLRGRRRRFVREIAESDISGGFAGADTGTGEFEEQTASDDALRRAFDRLSPDDRTVLVLHHLERRPVADIAGALGISIAAAKSRLFSARRTLERALEVELR